MKIYLLSTKRKITLLAALALLLLSAAPLFIGSGLDAPEPLGRYLNFNFPAAVPNSNGLPYAPVYTNLTFDSPLTFNELPTSAKIVVGQRDGKIFWFDKDPDVSQKNMLLDLSNKVGVVWDGGFLGFTFHPKFGTAGNNYFYTYYTTKDRNGNNYPNMYTTQSCNSQEYWGNFLILSRYTMNPTTMTVNESSEQVMLKLRMYGTTHRGGGLLFGDDGYLYLTTGDQTAFKKSQDIINNLDGGVLRLDVDRNPARSHAPIRTMPQDHGFSDEITGVGYWIPNDNPFLSPNGTRFEEYYSMGHRNPHRMTKDRATGDLYIGEIGGGRHEEINVVKKGKNYGWPLYEGLFRSTFCVSGLYENMPHEEPLVAFPRSQANAVIGGFVYRGEEIPELKGKYICADYGVGEEIWAVDTSNGAYEQLGNFSSTNIISFGEDKQGELYILKQGVSTLFKLSTKKSFEETLPQTLSATGAFTDLSTLTPSQGIFPYELIESFWSDGALKKRWLGIPNDGTHNTQEEQINYSENGNWDFPIGSVLIKHFEMPLDENNPSVTKRLETRFSVKAANGQFYYVTYKWNEAQTDAVLLTSGLDETLNIIRANGTTEAQVWTYPSRSDCVTCHNPSTGGTIGTRTRYLNKELRYPRTGRTANQLVTLSHLGILDQTITDANTNSLLTYKALTDANASLDEKARSYLDLNCAYCHQAGSDVRADFDMRMLLNLEQTGLLDAGIFNSLGIPDEAILRQGSPEKSIIYLRANSLQEGIAMPPIAKNKIDANGVALLEAWIRQLGSNTGPNEVNLALNKPAVQSSNDFGGDAAKAVDGNRSGLYSNGSVTHTATSNNPWWRVDLGREYTINKINMYNRTDCCYERLNGAKILVGNTPSNNPADYIEVGTATADPSQFFTSVNTSGRYLMVYLPGNNKILSLAEVEVFGEVTINIPVYNVLTSPNVVNLQVGETFQLNAITEPANATDQGVSWISNDPSIASIDATTGLVTAVGPGEIDVTVTTNDGGFRASALIRVAGTPQNPIAVYNVLTSPSQVNLQVGETFLLNAITEPANATDQSVSWISNDPSIATIDATTGLVTANGAGEIDVTVTTNDGGYKASALIKVIGGPAPNISVYNVLVSPKVLTLNVGETFLLNAIVEPDNATNKNVRWFSNDPTIVSVDPDSGLVTANTVGEMDVSVVTEDGGYHATVLVKVIAPNTSSIKLYPMPATDTFNIDLSGYMGKAVVVSLYGPGNQLLKTVNYPANHPAVNQFSVSEFPSGVNYLLFESVDGYEGKTLIIK
ncbi:hypothetical protein DZC72_05065 [Maribacter algicola]|uniref:F5/8 type C domain-containing protein n=1 Tax=Maribacter algicola TaxID=2498892 RepID=A0A3R8S1I8_9FLAO|nr:Ig-like domain-containing protein [Maribacter algicola]RRQ49956.1 hypothetical protein DZC72_05065 [Maribacter algicola]